METEAQQGIDLAAPDYDDIDDLEDLDDMFTAASVAPASAAPPSKPTRDELRKRLRCKISNSADARTKGNRQRALDEAVSASQGGAVPVGLDAKQLNQLIESMMPQSGAPNDRKSRKKIARMVKNVIPVTPSEPQSAVAVPDSPADPEPEIEEIIA